MTGVGSVESGKQDFATSKNSALKKERSRK